MKDTKKSYAIRGEKNPMFGKKHWKGKQFSEEWKRNISLGLKGNIPWNKGKKGLQIAWNKTLTKETDERVRKYALSENRYKFPLGNHSANKEKLRLLKKGVPRSKETIQKIKEKRALQITLTKDTSIELKIQNFLKALHIEFFTHQYMHIEHGYQCDILIPSTKTIIECFGDYWHKIPYGNPLDTLRCQELREQGYRVLIFWEKEIKVMELNDFKKIVNL